MKKLLGAAVIVSMIAPVFLLLPITKDIAITRILTLPLAIVTAALLNLMLSVARRDRLFSFGQFNVVALVSGITCLMMSAGVMEIIVRYFPNIDLGTSLRSFYMIPFIVSSIIPCILYSLGIGSVYWLLGVRNNQMLLADIPKFVSSKSLPSVKARPVPGVRQPMPDRKVANY